MNQSFVAKQFFRILPVQILMCIISAVNGLVDSLVGSRFLGAEAMAAVGLFSPVNLAVVGVMNVICVGGVIVVTQCIGKMEKDLTNRVFTMLNSTLTGLMILVSIALLIWSQPISVMLGAEAGNSILSQYVRGTAAMYPFQIIVLLLLNAAQLTGNDRSSYLSIGVNMIFNIISDLLLVAVLKLGIFGLGLSSGLGAMVQCLILLPVFTKKDSVIHFDFSRMPWSLFKDVIKAGMPSALTNISVSLKTLLMNFLLLSVGGTMAVAACSVENTFLGIICSITIGVSQTVLILMSLYVGEEDRDSMDELFRISVKTGILMSILPVVLIVVFARPLAMMFYPNEPEALMLTTDVLRIFPVFLPFNVFTYIIFRCYQSQRKMVLSNVFSFIESVSGAVFAYVLSFFFGIRGIWAGLPTASIVLAAVIFLIVFISRKKITLKPLDLMLVTDEIGVDEEDRMACTFTTIDEAIGVSEDVCSFVKRHGLSDRIVYASGLSVEEIAILLFRYSLTQQKNPHVEIRLIYKNGGLMIRLRDNGRFLFNGDKIDFNDPEDPTANLGIRMLQTMAKEITANSIMGLNVITVKI